MDEISGALGCMELTSNTETTAQKESEFGTQDALKGIPVEQIHTFRNIRNALEIIHKTRIRMNNLPCPYITFLDTSPQQVKDFESVQTPGTRKQYFQSLRILNIKLSSKPHEVVTKHIFYRLRRSAILMGNVDEELCGTGSTTYRLTKTIFRNSCKEADGGIIPHQRRPGRHGWPTIVFESAVSQGLARLQEDARWWLIQSHQEVHAVLLTHIFAAERIIDIEVWRMLPIHCAGTSDASDAQCEPQIDNQLRIDCSTVPPTISGLLPFFVISFSDLVLRDKTTGEGDFFLDLLDIQSIASVFQASM